MNLQPEDFWSYYEWLIRPDAFMESALLQGIVLIVLSIVLGLLIGYIIAAARYGPVEGFYAVARMIRDLLCYDLPGTSIRRIVALARLAVKEAIRRKVLFVVALFVVLLLLAGWYLNPDSDDPARLYISFVLTATNYLILALALFISAFSLPEDIKRKTIYTIVTKPVRATEIVLGRMLGFVAVGTPLLIVMGLISCVFVERGLQHSHYEVEDVKTVAGGHLQGVTDYHPNHRHSHEFTILNGESDGLTNIVRGHQHVVTRNDDADDKFSISGPDGGLRARIPSYGEIEFLDRSGNRKELGIDVGAERLAGGYGSSGVSRVIGLAKGMRKIEHSYIEGATLAAAIYTFKDVTLDRYPPPPPGPDGEPQQHFIPVDLTIRAYRSYKGDIESGIGGSITIKHPDNDAESNPIPFVVDEYQIDERPLPVNLQGIDENGEARELNIFDDLVNEKGEMKLIIKCLDRSQYLGMTKAGVYLRPQESSFRWNFFKAYASIWLQMTMVIAFGVMFSTFLSGPVAMVATFVCVLMGFSAEQIYDTRHYIDEGVSMGGGPVESLVRLLKQDAMTTELDVESTASKVIKTADAGIVYALDAIATALPNLPKMVSTAEYAASGFDIFGALLARHATATLGYCILAFLISYFFLKSREIAA